MAMQPRCARPGETDAVLNVHRTAFGQDTEADLVANLLDDPTAQPSLSMLVQQDTTILGHVLFTKVSLNTASSQPKAAILCPLAVAPDHQGKGTGAALIRAGLETLSETGFDLVFVFGDPAYYGRYGFQQADFTRYPTPHPIPDGYHPGWMVQALAGQPSDWQGQIICAEALDKPEYWAE